MKKKIVARNKKLTTVTKMVVKDKLYSLDEAIELAKKTSYSKFDGTVEAHFNFDLDMTAPEQGVRVTTSLPHGTGKTVKVLVFSSGTVKGADLSLGEDGIAQIEQGKLKPKIDFDIVVSEPAMMAKLAKVAKILGPIGLMPNPKNGTVSTNLEKTVTELKKGRVELKLEPIAPVIHTKIGKVSFSAKDLQENFLEVFKTIKGAKPQKAEPTWIKSAFLASTMGPSIKVDLSTL